MVENWAEWASEHGQLTKIGISDGCGGENTTTRCNLGVIAMNLKVIWGMSVNGVCQSEHRFFDAIRQQIIVLRM